MMKIGYISFNDPHDISSWSGIKYNLFNKLKSAYDIEWIAPDGLHGLRHKIRKKIHGKILYKYSDFIYFIALNLTYRLQGMSFRELFHKDYAWYYSIAFAKYIGKSLQSKIEKSNFDILFAPNAISEIAFLQNDIPIISLNDCTFAGMVGYYPHLSNLTDRNIKEGNVIEYNAIHKASQSIYSSSWAIDTAVKFYNADTKNLNLIHFGSNLLTVPKRSDLKCKKDNKLRLLFIGVDWERKGGDLAVEALNVLNSRGIATELTIVGCNPELSAENIRIIPYLNKDRDRDLKILLKIFRESDLLILPTRAECSAIVFCEASAFGMPIITTDTGGVPDYVKSNFNGYRLPLSARGIDYADVIMNFYCDEKQYFDLRQAAREKYEYELNWDVWLSKFKHVVSKL
jgi:glycosyltransferase involved in cell wall biosynthesis